MDKQAKIAMMSALVLVGILMTVLVLAGMPQNNGKPQCKDGRDNDGDGLIDYPADPGCTSLEDRDETNLIVTACGDGTDNDNDGLVDYPNDSGCSSQTDNSETSTSLVCDNGVDETNDADTLADYRLSGGDAGCTSPTDNNERDGPCDDLSDNDGDGLIDRPSDPECGSFADVEHDCSDTDGGQVYTVQGTTSGSFGGTPFNSTDSCVDAVTLTEYYCNPYNLGSQNVNCAMNQTTSCSNGACV